MNILDRYIAKHILFAVLLVTLVILGIELLLATQEVLGRSANDLLKTYQLVILRTLPYRLYDYFPTLVFIGTLLGMGQMAAHNEFVPIQAAGVSVLQLVKSVLKTALILIVLNLLWGEVIAPKAERYALSEAMANHQIQTNFQTDNGMWMREKSSFIHIKQFSDKVLYGITEIEVTQEFTLKAIHSIESARFNQGLWLLENKVTSLFDKNHNVTLEKKPHEVKDHWLNPAILEILVREPKTMTLPQLWRYARYLEDNHLNGALFEQILWQKLFSPVAIAVMVFLSIPLLLGPLRNRKLGMRLLVGCALGFCYIVLYQILATTAQIYHIPPFLSVSLPALLFLILGIWLTNKRRV